MSAVVVHSVGATVIFVCPRRRYGVTYEEKRGRIFKGLTSYELPHFHLLSSPLHKLPSNIRVPPRLSPTFVLSPFYPVFIKEISFNISDDINIYYIYSFFQGSISYPLDK